MVPVTATTDISFEPLTRGRFPLLSCWLAAPHVFRWWNHEWSPEAIERDFGATVDGREPAEDLIALDAGVPVGLVQYCLIHDYPEYLAELTDVVALSAGTASIDYLIGEVDLVGRGLGTRVIRAFVDDVWATRPAATEIVVPVNLGNVASWKALLKAGFTLVGQAELEPDVPGDDRRHQILRLDRPTAAPTTAYDIDPERSHP